MLRNTMSPELLELMDTGSPGDVDFYCQYARIGGGPVLVLMCGTGRIAIPIARQGIPVMAVDPDAGALDLARRKAQEAGASRAMFVQADPGGFATESRYALALIPGGRLQEILTLPEQRECLLAIRRSLQPGGRLLFDVPLWEPAAPADEMTVVRRHGDRVVALRRQHRYEAARQLAEGTVECRWLGHDGSVERAMVTSYYRRYATPGEMVLLLETCGFTSECYGGFDQQPLLPGAKRMLMDAVRNR